jgi:hypothetical protein
MLEMHRTEEDERTGARRDKLEGTVNGYFPPVIEREVFHRIASRMRTKAPRGRNADQPAKSIVAGVIRCAHCGRTVLRISKGEYVYLVCSMAHAKANCRYQAVPYALVETALRETADVLFEEAPRGRNTEEVEAKIANLEFRIDELADEAHDLAREYRNSRSPSIRQQLRNTERDLDDARRALNDARKHRDRIGAPYLLRRLEVLKNAHKSEPFDVGSANQALRACVSQIILDAEAGKLWVHWADADTLSYVPFV